MVPTNWLWRVNSNRNILKPCCDDTSRNTWLVTPANLQTPFWPRRDDCFSYSVCYANPKPRCKPSNLVSKLLQPSGNLSERNNKNKFQFRFRKNNIHFKIVFLFGNQVEIMIIFSCMYRDWSKRKENQNTFCCPNGFWRVFCCSTMLHRYHKILEVQ